MVYFRSGAYNHILTIAPAFDLRVYQSPTGGDVRDLLGALNAGREQDPC